MKGNFTEKLTNTISVRWSRLTSTVTSHVNNIYPWHDMIKMPLYIYGLLSNSIKQLWLVEHPIKSVLLKTVKVFKFKECLRNHHNQEEPKNIWRLNAMRYPRWDRGIEKEILGENLGNLKKLWTSFNNNVSISVH